MSNLKTLKPFQSGYDPRRNIKGRPKKVRNIKTILTEQLMQYVGEGKDKMQLQDYLVKRIIDKALKGDRKLIQLIWEYMDGKPPKWKGDPIIHSKIELEEKTGVTPEDEAKIKELFVPRPIDPTPEPRPGSKVSIT
jgi:hypothetical protein